MAPRCPKGSRRNKKLKGLFQTKKKIRQGPSESARLFREGTTKLGNDGNMWVIITTDSGIHRWSRIKKQNIKSSLNKILDNILTLGSKGFVELKLSTNLT